MPIEGPRGRRPPGVGGPSATSPVAESPAPPEAPATGWVPARSGGARASGATAPSGEGRPPVGANAYDVSAVTPEQLAALRRGSPGEQRLGATLARCQRNYAGLLASGARVVVSTPAGNSGQPVVTLVPPGFDPGKPARVHTHYHGWNSSVAEPSSHPAAVTQNVGESFVSSPQTLFVLPECANVPATTSTPTVKTDWSTVKNITTTTEDALAAAGYPALVLSERVVSAHSGGGRALTYAMAATPDGSGLRADRLELQDCLYAITGGTSSREAVIAWARTPEGARAKAVVYYEGRDGANDAKPNDEMRRVLAGRLFTFSGYSHYETVSKTFDKPPG